MRDLEIINKNKEDIDKIVNNFLKKEIINSEKLYVTECSLYAKYSPPKISLQYEKAENEFIEINFYKEHQLNDYWNLDISKGILLVLNNIPELTEITNILVDIHYIHSSLTSLNTRFKINTYGDLKKLKSGIDNCSELNNVGIFGKITINAEKLEVVKVEFESDLLNYIISKKMDNEDFTFFGYKLTHEIVLGNIKLEFTKKKFKAFNSTVNRPPKLLTENKEVYEKINNKDFFMCFKRELIKKMMSDTLQTLNVSSSDLKLRDFEFLKLLDY